MPCITDKTPLECGCYFHIYNRGINREKIFYEEAHYIRFMRQYKKLLRDHVETYAYCLLPNHFHFLIRIRDSNIPGFEHEVSTRLNILFSQHALSINRERNRYGSLFCKSFKRIKIKSEFYLQNLTVYIHRNPLNHKISNDFVKYRYNSFQEIIRRKSGLVNVEEVIGFFGSSEEFILKHIEEDSHVFLGKLKIEKLHIPD